MSDSATHDSFVSPWSPGSAGPSLAPSPLWHTSAAHSFVPPANSSFDDISDLVSGLQLDDDEPLDHDPSITSFLDSPSLSRNAAAPSRPSPAPPSQRRCHFYLQGCCRKGSDCPFSHSPSPTASPPRVSPPPDVSFQPFSHFPTFDQAALDPLAPALSSLIFSADALRGNVSLLCRDQHGCRLLQRCLEESDDLGLVHVIFEECVGLFSELMVDPFGNYLCQKLLERCDEEQRVRALRGVVGELPALAKNMHGTRAVQKMLEKVKGAEEKEMVVRALRADTVDLILDLNGNHVVQRALQHFGDPYNQFVYDVVLANCVLIASHRHGCCVLQRCVDFASPAQLKHVVHEITNCALPLVKDPFGNYVVQYILDIPELKVGSDLIPQLSGHVLELSMQKFSSNVIEKCLQVTLGPARGALLREIASDDVLPVLVQDPFANYVVQTALNVADPIQYAMLIDKIRLHVALLRNTPYGKRILARVMRENAREGEQKGGSEKITRANGGNRRKRESRKDGKSTSASLRRQNGGK